MTFKLILLKKKEFKKYIKMPISHTDRWKCQILSPLKNTDVLWEGQGPTTKSIVDKYTTEIGNDFLTIQKLNRCSLGRSKNPLIKLFKIGDFGTRNIEQPSSPTKSDESD